MPKYLEVFQTNPIKHEIKLRSFATIQLILKPPEMEHYCGEFKIKVGKCKFNSSEEGETKVYKKCIYIGNCK